MEPKSLCIKLQEFSFLSPFPWGTWVLSAWRLHIWWRQPLPWSLTMGTVMNIFGFCPFHSIENNVLLAQVIRLCICLSFFLDSGFKKKQLLLVPLSKDFGASTDYHVFKTVDSSNVVFSGLFLTHLLHLLLCSKKWMLNILQLNKMKEQTCVQLGIRVLSGKTQLLLFFSLKCLEKCWEKTKRFSIHLLLHVSCKHPILVMTERCSLLLFLV